MSDTKETTSVTHMSKRTELWAEVKRLRQELTTNDKKNEVVTTESVKKAAKVKKAVETAKNGSQSIVESLNNTVKLLQTAQEQHDNLQEAIKVKKDELNAVHGIECEVNTLVAVVAVKDQLVAEKDEHANQLVVDAKEKAAIIVADAEEKSKDMILEAQNKVDNANQVIEDNKAEVEKERKREVEEYEYNLKRDRTQKENKIKDELAEKSKSLDSREAAVKAREAEADNIDNAMKQMKEDIDKINEEKEQDIVARVDIEKKKIEKSHSFEIRAIKTKNESEHAIKDANIENLNKTIEDLNARLEKSDSKVDEANKAATDIAKSTVNVRSMEKELQSVKETASSVATPTGKR
tara:strand:+ start:274 stop:1326 length:1053 start_codon:yes stop_codon:yes gene_type:complete